MTSNWANRLQTGDEVFKTEEQAVLSYCGMYSLPGHYDELIRAAREWVEMRTGICYRDSLVTEYFSHLPRSASDVLFSDTSRVWELSWANARPILEIYYWNDANATWLTFTEAFKVDTEILNGDIRRFRITLNANFDLSSYDISETQVNRFKVEYRAGWENQSEGNPIMRQAILLLISDWDKDRLNGPTPVSGSARVDAILSPILITRI